MSYNLKSIKKEFKEKGIFYTTNDLAILIKSYIDVEFEEVYDPTCGDGSLLSVFDDSIKKYGQEINKNQLDIAKESLTNFYGVCGDTLKSPHFFEKKFKCIVANPPFSISWEQPILNGIFTDERFVGIPALPPKSKADYAFILHILHYLDNNGIAVVLNFPGILYRGNSEGKIRQWIVEKNYIEKVVRIPGKQFVDTNIETCLIVFKKNKSHKNIEFIDYENKQSYTASFQEIKDNDFILSVSSFVIEETEKEIKNPIELQETSREKMINKLKSDISIDKVICELDGYNFNDYLKSLEEVINSFKSN